MSTYTTAWIRFAILELLSRNPEGANLAQLAMALKPFDPAQRVGPVFQALRESGDIQDVSPRGSYALTEQGLASLERVSTMSLPRDITLPSREEAAAPHAVVSRRASASMSVYHVHRATPERRTLPMRTETPPSPPTTSHSDVPEAIVRVLEEAETALSPGAIYAALGDDAGSRGNVNHHLRVLVGSGALLAAGNTTRRRYTVPGREALLEIDDEPVHSNPRGDGSAAPVARERDAIVALLEARGEPMAFEDIVTALQWTKHRKTLRLQIQRLVKQGAILALGQTARRRYAAQGAAEALRVAAHEIAEQRLEPVTPLNRWNVRLMLLAVNTAIAALEAFRDLLQENIDAADAPRKSA